MPSRNPALDLPIPVSGIQPNKQPGTLGPAELLGCQNMLIEDGRLKTRPPLAGVHSTFDVIPCPVGDVIQGITAAFTTADEKVILVASAGTSTGTLRWYDASQSSGEWDPVDSTFTISSSGYGFTFVNFETQIGSAEYTKYLFFCNGGMELAYWNGEIGSGSITTAVTAYSLVPFTMDVINDRLVCGNFPSSPAYLMISDYLDPTSFPGVNDRNFGETPGDITCIKQLGLLRGVVYKSDAIFVMSPTGDVYPFQFEAKFRDIPGPVSPQSVVTLPNGAHLFLATDGGAYMFDGMSLTEVNPAVKVYIRARWDQKYAHLCHASYDRRQQMIFLFYVPAGSGNPQGCLALQYPEFSLWPMMYSVPVHASCRATQTKGLRIRDLPLIQEMTGPIGDLTQEQDVFLLALDDNRTSTYLGDSNNVSWVGFIDYSRGNANHTNVDDFMYTTATTPQIITSFFETPIIGAEDKTENKVMLEIEPLIAPITGASKVDIKVRLHETFDNRPVAEITGYMDFEEEPTSLRKAFGVRQRARGFSIYFASPEDYTEDTAEGYEYGGCLAYMAPGGRR